MARWFGKVGYAVSEETSPGVWEDRIVEREYFGDLNRISRRLQSSGEKLNDDIDISNEISIVSDPFAMDNFHSMRYATFGGTKWKISSVDVQYPRLNLSLGGVYNGN